MQNLDLDGPEHTPDTPAGDADVRAERESARESAQEAALSGDEPLPDRYPLDQIGLMVQGPERLYLYWRFAHDPAESLRRLFGAQAAHFHLALKLVETESEAVTYH